MYAIIPEPNNSNNSNNKLLINVNNTKTSKSIQSSDFVTVMSDITIKSDIMMILILIIKQENRLCKNSSFKMHACIAYSYLVKNQQKGDIQNLNVTFSKGQ